MANRPLTHLVDGIPADVVSISNRGLAYSDGLFETILFRGITPVLWPQHFARLMLGCEKLALRLPANPEQLLLGQCEQLLHANPLAASVIKILVTRSGIGRGYRPSPDAGVQTLLSLHPAPRYPTLNYSEGVNLWLCATRLAANPQFAGIKHLARLEQVMASMEFADPQYQEGLMLDQDNRVIECTRSNIFLEMDGRLVTPALNEAGVAGVMRTTILERGHQLGIGVMVEPVALEQLTQAQAGFVCNSVYGIWPIRTLRLGDDKMIRWQQGRITRLLQNHLFQTLQLGVYLV